MDFHLYYKFFIIACFYVLYISIIIVMGAYLSLIFERSFV